MGTHVGSRWEMVPLREITLVLLTLVVLPARADMLVRSYLDEAEHHSDRVKVYVRGQGDAYLWTNVELHRRGLAPLFCQPANVALTSDALMQMLDAQLQREKAQMPAEALAQMPLGLVLLDGLMTTFPCTASAQ